MSRGAERGPGVGGEVSRGARTVGAGPAGIPVLGAFLGAWLAGSAVAGVVFGVFGFLVVFWSPLLPLTAFLVRHPLRAVSDRRRSGLPAVDWGQVGCWFSLFGAVAAAGLVVYVGVEIVDRMLAP